MGVRQVWFQICCLLGSWGTLTSPNLSFLFKNRDHNPDSRVVGKRMLNARLTVGVRRFSIFLQSIFSHLSYLPSFLVEKKISKQFLKWISTKHVLLFSKSPFFLTHPGLVLASVYSPWSPGHNSSEVTMPGNQDKPVRKEKRALTKRKWGMGDCETENSSGF